MSVEVSHPCSLCTPLQQEAALTLVGIVTFLEYGRTHLARRFDRFKCNARCRPAHLVASKAFQHLRRRVCIVEQPLPLSSYS